MIEIRSVQMRDKVFWYSLDRHLSDEEFEKKVNDKMGYVMLEDDEYIGLQIRIQRLRRNCHRHCAI